MQAEYDSRANALSIELADATRWDGAETVDDDYCTIALAGGRVANIELLSPREHLPLLEQAAERHGLDSEALQAAAQSALAAPDRTGGARRARGGMREQLVSVRVGEFEVRVTLPPGEIAEVSGLNAALRGPGQP